MMLLSPLNAILPQGSSSSVWPESGGGGVPHSKASSQSKLSGSASVGAKATATSCFVFFFLSFICTHHRDPQLPPSYTHQTPGSEPAHIQTHAETSPELCIGDTGLPMYRQWLESKNSQTASSTAWADKIQQLVNTAYNRIQVQHEKDTNFHPNVSGVQVFRFTVSATAALPPGTCLYEKRGNVDRDCTASTDGFQHSGQQQSNKCSSVSWLWLG